VSTSLIEPRYVEPEPTESAEAFCNAAGCTYAKSLRCARADAPRNAFVKFEKSCAIVIDAQA